MNLQTLLSVFTDHIRTGEGTSIKWLGKLSVDELKKLDNTIHNMKNAAMSGLLTTGNLISAFKEDHGGFDHNATGWLVMHLTENVEGLLDLEYQVRSEFNDRGLDIEGKSIKGVRRG